MIQAALLTDYIRWHYTSAFVSIWRITNNFVYFFYNLFSIPLLLHTLFTPWKMMIEQKKKGFVSAAALFERVFGNFLVRIIGAIIRLGTITIGLVFCLGALVCGFVFTIFWVVAPLVMICSFAVGVRLII